MGNKWDRARRKVAGPSLVWLLSTCVFLGTLSTAQGQVFRYPEDMRPTSLLPFFADDMSSVRMVELIFDSLVFQNKRGDIEGALATRWRIDGDRKGITFQLRRGVKWHDGKAFSAADVVFTTKAAQNPKTIFQEKGQIQLHQSGEGFGAVGSKIHLHTSD